MSEQSPPQSIAILSFYSFTPIESPEMLLPKILLIGKKKYIKGTILIAEEGVNGSISGTLENVKLIIENIRNLTLASAINIKINYSTTHPFIKLKVKLKPEIIAMSKGELKMICNRGEYIETHQWDDFIMQSDVVIVDTRNNYEIEVGTFKGAINPNTETFKQFPLWAEQNAPILANKKIAMFCTGGIRCEKSTSYLKMLGHNKVYHLRGGILQYLEDTKNINSLWQGECFVFDDRRAVDDELSASKIIEP